MPRTLLFSRLRRLAAAAAWGHRRGLSEPAAVLTALEGLPRRDVLKLAGAGLAAVSVASLPGCGTTGAPVPHGGRVIVVGAGLAGTHCARRLFDAGADVVCYEASDRVGGRTFTGRGLFGDQLCELGGELIDSNHATMFALADELGITLDDREADAEGLTKEVWWVQGAAVPEAQLLADLLDTAEAFAEAYDGAEGDDLAYAELDNITLSAWLDTNVPSATYPALHGVLRSAYRGEFGLEPEEQSCLNLIYLFGFDSDEAFAVFGASDERYHAHEGSDAFATRLAGPLEAEGRLITDAALVALAGDDQVGFTATLQRGDGSSIVDKAAHVVLAIPFTTLRRVSLDVPLEADKRALIDALGYGTNTKVMGAFTSRVWRTEHAATGALTSDLALQQTWDSAIGQEGAQGILTNFLGGTRGAEAGAGGEDEAFEGILTELDAVWPGASEAYVTGSAVRFHWPGYVWSEGSYTCYRPGQWATYGVEGRREGNVHFAGEHTSVDFQGWMEGAAESGATVAAAILDDLGLLWPDALLGLVARRRLARTRRARRLRGTYSPTT